MKAEIEALHGRKAEAMRAMTQAQHRELEDICTASHMAVPPLPSTPSAEAGLSGAALCDQVPTHPSLFLLCCSPLLAHASQLLQQLQLSTCWTCSANFKNSTCQQDNGIATC